MGKAVKAPVSFAHRFNKLATLQKIFEADARGNPVADPILDIHTKRAHALNRFPDVVGIESAGQKHGFG